MTEEMVLLGCGDVGPIHEPMEQHSELMRDTLAGANIRFAQVERTYSERGELRPGSVRASELGVSPLTASHVLSPVTVSSFAVFPASDRLRIESPFPL
jgi:hypothetical protein